jgi:hypothetical protein
MSGLEPTQITIFHLMGLILLILCVSFGIMAGDYCFGTIGKITGGILGLVIGVFVGSLPDHLATRSLFKEVQQSTNDQLRTMVASGHWNFANTLALLHLAARDQEVRMELPRIISMLESDLELTRRYGWDALRLVFTDEYHIIEDYNPRGTTQECRTKIEILKAALKNMNEKR